MLILLSGMRSDLWLMSQNKKGVGEGWSEGGTRMQYTEGKSKSDKSE